MTSPKREQASNYKAGAAILGFLCVCSIIWMVRTEEPKRVVDDAHFGRDSRGVYLESEVHYEDQRGSAGELLGWLMILGGGGGAVWCWWRGEELAQEAESDRHNDTPDSPS